MSAQNGFATSEEHAVDASEQGNIRCALLDRQTEEMLEEVWMLAVPQEGSEVVITKSGMWGVVTGIRHVVNQWPSPSGQPGHYVMVYLNVHVK